MRSLYARSSSDRFVDGAVSCKSHAEGRVPATQRELNGQDISYSWNLISQSFCCATLWFCVRAAAPLSLLEANVTYVRLYAAANQLSGKLPVTTHKKR